MLLPISWLLVAALGRPGPAVAVCVVAPRVEAVDEGDARGEVPVGAPDLVVIEPLSEVRIERPGQASWSRRAAPGQVLTSPLAWPVAPIAPGEAVLVRLRPQQAPEATFAHIELIGAQADRMRATTELIASLGQRPDAWLAAIEAALVADDVPLAWALLFHPRLPSDPTLAALRQEVIRRGCGS